MPAPLSHIAFFNTAPKTFANTNEVQSCQPTLQVPTMALEECKYCIIHTSKTDVVGIIGHKMM